VNYALSGLKKYDPRNIYFHEAFVVEFIKYPTTIELKLERVFCEGQLKNVELSFHGIRKLEVDDKPAELPLMAVPDGEVLTLTLKDSIMELLIQWPGRFHEKDLILSTFNKYSSSHPAI
jgi:hypothetical protein